MTAPKPVPESMFRYPMRVQVLELLSVYFYTNLGGTLMMSRQKTPLELGRRERQIVETVVMLGEASVSEVRKNLADPPSYSAVRAMLGLLVEKKWLKYRQEGKRYLYRPATSKEKTRKTAVSRLLSIFFNGSPTDAFAALLDSSAEQLTEEDLQRMLDMVKKARKEKQ